MTKTETERENRACTRFGRMAGRSLATGQIMPVRPCVALHKTPLWRSQPHPPPWLTPRDEPSSSSGCGSCSCAIDEEDDACAIIRRETSTHSAASNLHAALDVSDMCDEPLLPWEQPSTPTKVSPRDDSQQPPAVDHRGPHSLLSLLSKVHSAVLDVSDESDEDVLPWEQPSSPPNLSPRERFDALSLDDDDASAESQPSAPAPERPTMTVRCCDVCEAIYAGAVCRCMQLSLTHPVARILARHRASIEVVGQHPASVDEHDQQPPRKKLSTGRPSRPPWTRYDDLES